MFAAAAPFIAELVCEGLDAAVMKMKKGEHAQITVHPPFSYPEGHAGKKAQVCGCEMFVCLCRYVCIQYAQVNTRTITPYTPICPP